MNDNSFELKSFIKKINFDDKGAHITIDVSKSNYRDYVDQLVSTSGTIVGVKITPSQTQLDVDDHKDADGQTSLIK